MSEFLQSLLISFLMAILAYVWKHIKSWFNKLGTPVYDENSKMSLSNIKKQFFISLFLSIATTIGYFTIKNVYIHSFCLIIAFFSFLALWGAFEAVFEIAENLGKNKKEEISCDTTQNHK